MKKRIHKWNIFKSFLYAFRGLFVALKQEPNIWIQISIGFVFTVIAVLNNKLTTAGINFVLTAFIISLEMVNTAVEALCDLVDDSQNDRIKFIKDVTAGAVLIAAIAWGAVLLYILATLFFPNLNATNYI